MADRKLVALMRQLGLADPAMDDDALANIAHLAPVQHLAAVLTADNYVDPRDVELLEAIREREEQPDSIQQLVEQLVAGGRGGDGLQLLDDDPELAAAVRELSELRQEAADLDMQLECVHACRGELDRAQQESAQLARAFDAVPQQQRCEQLSAAMAAQNSANNAAMAAVKAPSEYMAGVLVRRPENCLLLAHSLDDLVAREDSNAGDLMR